MYENEFNALKIVKNKLARYRAEYLIYKYAYYSLNILSFLLVSTSAILTAFFLAGVSNKKELIPDVFTEGFIKENFLILTAFLSAISSFAISLSSNFVMAKRFRVAFAKKNILELEMVLYKSKDDIYNNSKNASYKLYKRCLEIHEFSKTFKDGK